MAEVEPHRLAADVLAAAFPGELVTKFVILVEAVDGDGKTVFHTITSGAPNWDTLGMIAHADVRFRTAVADRYHRGV